MQRDDVITSATIRVYIRPTILTISHTTSDWKTEELRQLVHKKQQQEVESKLPVWKRLCLIKIISLINIRTTLWGSFTVFGVGLTLDDRHVSFSNTFNKKTAQIWSLRRSDEFLWSHFVLLIPRLLSWGRNKSRTAGKRNKTQTNWSSLHIMALIHTNTLHQTQTLSRSFCIYSPFDARMLKQISFL